MVVSEKADPTANSDLNFAGDRLCVNSRLMGLFKNPPPFSLSVNDFPTY